MRSSAKCLAAACAIALYGCNGGSSLTGSPTDSGELAGLSADPADELIRNSLLGFYTSAGGGGDAGGVVTLESTASPVADSSTGAADSSGGNSSRFSDTNLQEAGVDESDRVKIDGDVLFALETPDFGYLNYGRPVPEPFLVDSADVIDRYEPRVETLSAYKLDGDNSSVLSRLQLQELRGRSVSGMYLYKNQSATDLVLLSGQTFYPWASWGNSVDFGGLETRLSWIDASNTDAMSVKRSMDIQGHLISSRRIGNRLILVTRFHPRIDGVVPYAYTDADIENNRTAITNADAAEFMPVLSVSENGETTRRPVIDNNLCYSSKQGAGQSDDQTGGDSAGDSIAGTSVYYPSPSIISIITVDLDNLSTGINSSCFVGDSETLYVSQQAVYLATTSYNYGTDATIGVSEETSTSVVRPSQYYPPEITTDIHKFAFNGSGAPQFRGSGSVTGHLGWNPDRKPFRMSEKDNNLRVVTFDESLSESPVTLSVLREAGGKLDAISTLPNESRPDPIGKPGESLYASRFIGNKAYLVTFRVTDPLYVLDLSNPNDPRIAGELEIPGYSDYLHPVNDSLLIGLGKDAVPDNSGFGDGRGAWYQGVKLALYDVADPANPFVADERIIGKRGTESPALLQHHSFAYLEGGASRNPRMAIPISINDGRTDGRVQSRAEWTSNGVLTMEVDESSNRFVDVPGWTFESRAAGFQFSPIGLENDRAVIGSDNGLYVIHNGTLHYGQWGNSEPTSSVTNQ